MSLRSPLSVALLLAAGFAQAQRAPLQPSSANETPSTDEALWHKPPAKVEKRAVAPTPASGEAPAGSVLGPWAFMDVGTFLGAGTFVDAERFGNAGLFTSLSAGWGFDAGRVHLRPSARFGFAYELTLPDSGTGSRIATTPIAVSLAATNLLDEPVTGLRLTPAVGVSIPTSLGRSVPLTTLSAAIQLERRFGPIEFGLRSELGKPLYGEFPGICRLCYEEQPRFNWFWSNSLQAEGWFNESLSLGLSYAWNIGFGFPVPSDQVVSAPRDSNGKPLSPTFVSATDSVTGRVFFTWAITRLVGLSLDLSTTQPPFTVDRDGVRRVRFPFLSLGTWADNTTVFFLGFWFRTDAALSRNWIER